MEKKRLDLVDVGRVAEIKLRRRCLDIGFERTPIERSPGGVCFRKG
jgi:hypothetical protein